MANEKQAEQTEGTEEQEQGSSKKKLFIIIGLAVLVLVIGGAVSYFLMSGDSGSEDESSSENVQQPALYLDLTPPILSTFAIGGKQRYMQVSMSIMSRDQAALDAVEYHMPSIRSRLNTLFSGADFQLTQTAEGKDALRVETVKQVNAVLEGEGEPLIEEVFFTNFVMQ